MDMDTCDIESIDGILYAAGQNASRTPPIEPIQFIRFNAFAIIRIGQTRLRDITLDIWGMKDCESLVRQSRMRSRARCGGGIALLNHAHHVFNAAVSWHLLKSLFPLT